MAAIARMERPCRQDSGEHMVATDLQAMVRALRAMKRNRLEMLSGDVQDTEH
jgi:hypothetical protein